MLREQGDEFQRELAIAKQELIDDVFIDCVKQLRVVMNGGQQSREATSAAKALLRMCESHHRQGQRTTTPGKSQPTFKPVAEPEPLPLPIPVVQAPPAPVPTPIIVEQPVATKPVVVNVEPTAATNPTPATQPHSNRITPKTLHRHMFAKTHDPHRLRRSG